MSEQQKAFLSLPVRMGGIGIRDPVELAQLHTPSQETPWQHFSLNQRKSRVLNANTQWKTSKSACKTTWRTQDQQ